MGYWPRRSKRISFTLELAELLPLLAKKDKTLTQLHMGSIAHGPSERISKL